MRVEINESGVVESQHLPRVDQSLLLDIAPNGRVRTIEKLETPVDEYGVPDPHAFLTRLSTTLDSRYSPPSVNNRHHLAYPRALYHAEGVGTIPYKFRESPSLILGIPIQVHNYAHRVMAPAKPVPYEVMAQRVKEQDQITRLFSLGRSFLTAYRWLDEMRQQGTQTFQTAERYHDAHQLTPAPFYDYLDTCEDAQVGLMPDRESLATMPLPDAVRLLGGLSVAKALQLDRKVRQVIERNGL